MSKSALVSAHLAALAQRIILILCSPLARVHTPQSCTAICYPQSGRLLCDGRRTVDRNPPKTSLCVVRTLGAVTAAGVLVLLGPFRAQLLHLLQRHVVLVRLDVLFAAAGQLGLPLSSARLGLLHAVPLVVVDVFGSIFVVEIVFTQCPTDR